MKFQCLDRPGGIYEKEFAKEHLDVLYWRNILWTDKPKVFESIVAFQKNEVEGHNGALQHQGLGSLHSLTEKSLPKFIRSFCSRM